MRRHTLPLAAALALGTALPAAAVVVEAGPGGFDAGWATKIYYEDPASRGTANDRDNPLNALGATDGDFFEIGYATEVILTFGTLFSGSGAITEVTFGDAAAWPETVAIFVGMLGGSDWNPVDPTVISNADAQGPDGFTFTFDGVFDAVRIADLTGVEVGGTGGFDIDSVRVAPIPLPAGGVLLLGALGGLAALRRKRG